MGKFLTEEQVIVLKQAHKTIRDKRLADRIKAVLSLNAGHDYQQVASILLLDKYFKLKSELEENDEIYFLDETHTTHLEKHPLGRIYLIWDNARYYYRQDVQDYFKHNPRPIPKFLPSYSPNLNLIERLWRLFHQKILYNHYYQTFSDFKQAVLGFFANLHHYKKEMTTLLTDNFQLVPT